MSIQAKRLYEKIVLNNYQPTDEEKKVLEGTRWKQKLDGAAPLAKPGMPFKTFFKEDTVPTERLTRSKIAEHLIHCIEEMFEVHFTDKLDEKAHQKFPEIKNFCVQRIVGYNGDEADKTSLVKSVGKTGDLHTLLIKLNLASAGK